MKPRCCWSSSPREEPADIRPVEALGNIMRGHKRYEEAVDYYSRAIALIGKPEKKNWTQFYARGTCYERIKKWPQAEADLQKAMQLSPDQPLVLNYLGYSWVDQNRNLKQGLALIERAVQLKPDDGYIVDSLGWAHYRMGNIKEAVRFLERAVELKPEDPVLNDHLGDALWRVERPAGGALPVGAGADVEARARGDREDQAQAGEGSAGPAAGARRQAHQGSDAHRPQEAHRDQARPQGAPSNRRSGGTVRHIMAAPIDELAPRQDQPDVARARPPAGRLS